MDTHFKVELIRSQIHQWLVNEGLNSFTSPMPEIELLERDPIVPKYHLAEFVFDYDNVKILGICTYTYWIISNGNIDNLRRIILRDVKLLYPVKGKMDFTKCKMIWEEIKDDEY